MTRPGTRRRMPLEGVLGTLLLLTFALLAGPARAAVDLRVEALPISEPIEAFVTVTDLNGDPVGGLAAGDFTVTLDGVAIPLANFTLPPSQDPSQRVSVVFVMDYSPSIQGGALADMENSVISFINAMNIGDFAAIVKFNDTNPSRASVVLPFTEIDGAGGAGTNMLISAVMSPYPGAGTNLLDAIDLAVDQFSAPPVPLPSGPKAVIAVSDGGENSSNVDESTVIANANANGIPVFTIGQGDVAGQNGLQLLTELAAQTGGDYLPAPTPAEITAAYATISLLLNNEYLLTIPASSVTDCSQHTLQVTVTSGQVAPASVSFIRCDVTPDAFSFTNQASVAPNTVVTSNSVTISGVETAVAISVASGGYSIGCNGTFTTSAGTINNGQTVCVRHTASASFSANQVTTLTVGGVSGAFTSTTAAAPPPAQGGGGGGGGAMGIAELLLGLGVLAARRRRRPA